MKKIIIAIMILGCLAGIVLGGNALLENAYWVSATDTGRPDISRYQEDILLSKDYNAELHQYFQENYHLYMRKPTDAELAFIQTHKDYVIAYYQDTYGIDLSQKIQSVEPFMMDFTFMYHNFGCNINGYYDEDEHFLAITEDMLSIEDFSIHSTIVHELVHASGIWETNSEFIAEGFTEAVTNRIMNRNNLYFSELGPYRPYWCIANQLLAIDDQIVLGYITDEDFSVVAYLDEIAGEEIGATLEDICTVYAEGKQQDTMEFYMQYCVGNILKQYSEEARSIAQAYPIPVALFGLRTLFAAR